MSGVCLTACIGGGETVLFCIKKFERLFKKYVLLLFFSSKIVSVEFILHIYIHMYINAHIGCL